MDIINKNKKLKLVNSNNSSMKEKEDAKEKLEEVEEALANETAADNVEKVKGYIKSVETLDGNFCQVSFWKLKRRLWPSDSDPPMGKSDGNGNLITAA